MRRSRLQMTERETAPIARHFFAHHVRRLRHERGWSQLQLAEAAGIHRTHVSRLENSVFNASIDTVDDIAGAFGVRACTLLESPAAG